MKERERTAAWGQVLLGGDRGPPRVRIQHAGRCNIDMKRLSAEKPRLRLQAGGAIIIAKRVWGYPIPQRKESQRLAAWDGGMVQFNMVCCLFSSRVLHGL
ncbi:hypothetical protein DBR47_14000 [Paucibacter sp. KBW04]|nr:hypothetical protein DBR47_14000 [Paucibacter sp. KBW04]